MKGDQAGFNKEYKQIGSRLRALRRAAGYTSNYDFAYDIDMIPSQYAAYERGKNMEIEQLLIILKGLKITLAEFFSEGFD